VSEHQPQRKRVLLLAYYCNPNFGSEPGAGWNRALETAKHFDTWVISHSDNAHAIRDYFQNHPPILGLNFLFVESPPWENRVLDTRWLMWLVVHRWHFRAFQVAKRLCNELELDLIHQVTPAAYREPGYLWQLDVPFVWGPVGGTQNLPWRFLLEAGPVRALSEAMRNITNFAQLHWSRRVKQAAQRAAVLLVANSSIRESFQQNYGRTGTMTCDVGIKQIVPWLRTPRPDSGPLRILWSGDLEPRKALSLLLKALAQLPPGVNFELRVLGEGRMERRLKGMAADLGIDSRITWFGRLPHSEAIEQCGWADVFAFTSLRDTLGTVVLEALANGLPVICLDHQGVRDAVTGSCGVKVPVTNRRQVVRDLSDALACLARDPQRRAAMSAAAIERARDFLWSQLGSDMLDIYQRVLATRDRKPRREEWSDLSGSFNPPDISNGVSAHQFEKKGHQPLMQPLATFLHTCRKMARGGKFAETDPNVLRTGEV